MRIFIYTIILTFLIISCKDKKKADSNVETINIENLANEKIVQQSTPDLNIRHIEIEGQTITLLVPPNEVFKNKIYDEEQAAKIIYMNIDINIQKKISPSRLLKLINFQGDYVESQEKLKKNYLNHSKENSEFLNEKMKSIGVNLNLSIGEINTILKTETYYMKLINY